MGPWTAAHFHPLMWRSVAPPFVIHTNFKILTPLHPGHLAILHYRAPPPRLLPSSQEGFMATPNQINANRQNAQRSTGPRSPEPSAPPQLHPPQLPPRPQGTPAS